MNLSAEVQVLRASLEEANQLAHHDPLTGLPNRRTITEIANRLLERATPRHPLAALFIDVDRFKLINDLYGHMVGDRTLVEVTQRLQQSVRPGDHVARLGGDEFVILLENANATVAAKVADRVQSNIGPTIDMGHRQLPLSVSVGLSIATSAMDAGDLIGYADTAMYRAKQDGRARVAIYDDHMLNESRRRAQLERELCDALQDGQLAVQYQPILALADRRIIGFEAFVRWNHPRLGVLPAGEFVPIAEDVGQVWAIDAFMLSETGLQAARWQRAFPSMSELIMSVNLSANQFREATVTSTVAQAVELSGVDPSTFQLELSEATLMDPRGTADTTIGDLKQLGVKLAIDNFGSAASSLIALKQLGLDSLKIDRRLTAGLGKSADDEAITVAILSLAKAFHLTAIAEGVESEIQAAWLLEHGCPAAQGYHLSRPIDAAAAEALLRNQS